MAPLLHDSLEAFLLVDDRVRDKRYRRFIEVVKRQYSGNVHGMVTGIGLVNLVHRSGEAGDFLPFDFRLYAPDLDQKIKNDHFQDLFQNATDWCAAVPTPATNRWTRSTRPPTAGARAWRRASKKYPFQDLRTRLASGISCGDAPRQNAEVRIPFQQNPGELQRFTSAHLREKATVRKS